MVLPTATAPLCLCSAPCVSVYVTQAPVGSKSCLEPGDTLLKTDRCSSDNVGCGSVRVCVDTVLSSTSTQACNCKSSRSLELEVPDQSAKRHQAISVLLQASVLTLHRTADTDRSDNL